jgi:isoleucyl-tRNA synthetase
LGAVYLDVIKDRLYTMGENSQGRESARKAMYLILEALVRWIAPILSFTAEEIWVLIPGEREESVFMDTWFDGLVEYDEAPYNRTFWSDTHVLINEVNAAIEMARSDGKVGGSLEAEIHIKPKTEAKKTFLETWGSELRFPLIVSEAVIADEQDAVPENHYDCNDYVVWVEKSSHEKCVRCWHQRESVGRSADHPELCGRCIENIGDTGEERLIG